MRICIHRGTQEIGGTCIEVEAQGQRIALDVGLPLDAPDDEPRKPAAAGPRLHGGRIAPYLGEVAQILATSLNVAYYAIAPHVGTPEWKRQQARSRRQQ